MATPKPSTCIVSFNPHPKLGEWLQISLLVAKGSEVREVKCHSPRSASFLIVRLGFNHRRWKVTLYHQATLPSDNTDGAGGGGAQDLRVTSQPVQVQPTRHGPRDVRTLEQGVERGQKD